MVLSDGGPIMGPMDFSEAEVVDAQLVDEDTTSHDDLLPPVSTPASTSTALGSPVLSGELSVVDNANQMIDAARLEGRMLRQTILEILQPSDIQVDGKTQFVKAEGWHRVCKRLRVIRRMVDRGTERDAEGKLIAASAIVSAEWTHGYEEGDGYCARSEFIGRAANDTKIEHGMQTRATTRAKNRATEALFGIGKITLADVLAAHASRGIDLSMGPAFDPAVQEKALRALHYLLGAGQGTDAFLAKLAAEHGYVPLVCVRAVALAAAQVKQAEGPAVQDPGGVGSAAADAPGAAKVGESAGSGQDIPTML